ncbi:MAG TPA: ABC transporter substrate-binding protein [Bacteroidales bacterium]|nr:ABC transporter substrate-binding protein [Bacteroidales bacterium]
MSSFLSLLPALIVGTFCFISSFSVLSAAIITRSVYPEASATLCLAPPAPGYADACPPPEGVPIAPDSYRDGKGDVKTNKPIKIGLLIQTSASIEARNGAEMAIDEANRAGGFHGKNFELIVKSMEGPWGTGSKQAVDMIFIDEVIAIVGSHDGRNAHLVEQATTKANVTFLSAWAGDPTLSQAFTPWFFNIVPDDNQQAEMLAMEINRKKYKNLTLVTDDDYDAKSAFRSFSGKAEASGTVRPVSILYNKSDSDISEIAEIITARKTDCLLLFTGPVSADKIICKMEEIHSPAVIYGPLSLLRESSPVYKHPEVLKNLLILTSGKWYREEISDFARNYHEKYKQWPGATASYSYDAIMMMVKAVIIAGGKREGVQQALISLEYFGETGEIKFDKKGNRICTIGLVE